MGNKDIFKLKINDFGVVLTRYGFNKKSFIEDDFETMKESIRAVYSNLAGTLEISFLYGKHKDESSGISMSMYNDKKGPSFSLYEFLTEHKRTADIVSQCPSTDDFELFISKYFKDLEIAFDTYLNDQVTGKTFTDHSNKLMEGYR